jgi:NADH:ubiquinone oxidoreductase subunit H
MLLALMLVLLVEFLPLALVPVLSRMRINERMKRLNVATIAPLAFEACC